VFKCVTVKDSAQCSSKIKHVPSVCGKWFQHDLSNNHKQEHGCLSFKCNLFEVTPNFLQPIELIMNLSSDITTWNPKCNQVLENIKASIISIVKPTRCTNVSNLFHF